MTSDEGRYVIGSAEDCDIRIADDPYVSSHHCLLTVDGTTVSVEDLGSTNGTWINDHVRVWNTIYLPEGARLRVGRTTVPTGKVFAAAREAERQRENDAVKAAVLAANPDLTGDQADQVVTFVRNLQQEADKAVNEILAHLADLLERKVAEAPGGPLAPGLAVAVKVIRTAMETT